MSEITPAHPTAITVFHQKLSRLDPHTPNAHPEHVFTYIERGSLVMEHGERLSASAGEVIVLPSGVPHRLLEVDELELWGVSFCGGCVNIAEDHPFMRAFRLVRRGGFPLFSIAEDRRARVGQLFSYLSEDVEENTEASWELSRCSLMLLLGELERALSDTLPHAPPETLVSHALRYIEEHCFEAISLADVARAVGRTPAHVTTCVRQETGSTVGHWITTARVSEAARRLVHTDDGLDLIAEHVGWKDPTHLIRQFKKVYGMTPARWRKQNRREHRQESL